MHRACHPDLAAELALDASIPPSGTLSRQISQHISLQGPEAEHLAHARRARVGEPIALHDGAGLIATGRIESVTPGGKREGALVRIVIDSASRAEPGTRVHVFTAVPKGGRIDEMVEQLSQVGAWSWSPHRTARSIVEPRETKLERLERITVESMKQCGRAWRLHIADSVMLFQDALSTGGGTLPAQLILADASGTAVVDWLMARRAAAEGRVQQADIRLLIGPEGGWTPEELAAAQANNAAVLSFGPHAMRIETAAVVAAAVLRLS